MPRPRLPAVSVYSTSQGGRTNETPLEAPHPELDET